MKGYKEYYKELEEKQKEMTDKEYDAFFAKMLKKYKVSHISELDKKQKSAFFKEIDKAVKSDEGK